MITQKRGGAVEYYFFFFFRPFVREPWNVPLDRKVKLDSGKRKRRSVHL